MNFDQKRLFTLIGTVVLAGIVVAAGIWGPSVWKAMRQQPDDTGQVVIQTPAVDQNEVVGDPAGTGKTDDGQKAVPGNTEDKPTTGTATQTETGTKKYKDPDATLLDLAPSIAGYFTGGGGSLSETAKNVAYGAAWNIHQYVDGYLYGPTAGPQMNEEDIKKYIVFHKSLWDKQVKDEAGVKDAAAFSNYMTSLFNRGIDAFDAKDKSRIEQFHQEIHDLDARLFRNDLSSKIYGSTPFATKR